MCFCDTAKKILKLLRNKSPPRRLNEPLPRKWVVAKPVIFKVEFNN